MSDSTRPRRGQCVCPTYTAGAHCVETLKVASSAAVVDLRHCATLQHGFCMARDGLCPPDRGLRIRLRSAGMSWGSLGEGVGEGRSAGVRKASLLLQRSANVGPYRGKVRASCDAQLGPTAAVHVEATNVNENVKSSHVNVKGRHESELNNTTQQENYVCMCPLFTCCCVKSASGPPRLDIIHHTHTHTLNRSAC